jgi:predicted AlkP superfamily phosphohydrolase/phosphomutase/Flp pilus assembly protein TadD
MSAYNRYLVRLRNSLVAAVVALGLGCGGHKVSGRVLVLGLDGLDPRVVDLLMSEGKMPSFAKLRQDGAYGRLISSKPLLSPVVWNTIATGKTPDQHGIGHFVAIDDKTGESLPVTSEMRRVKAVWDILSDKGRKVAVVGWWATWPAPKVNGEVVSDHTCYHFLFPQGESGARDTANLTYPPELLARITPLIRRPADVTPQEAAPYIRVSPEELSKPFDFNDDVSHFKWALATADSYRRIGLELWSKDQPDLLMAYTEGTDSVAHLFGHLFRAPALSGELAAQQEKFGQAVEQMYLYADRLVGEYMRAMDARTTLVVVSDHGFELGATQDDPSKTRDMRRVSEQFHRLEGIAYLYGYRVKRARLEEPKILDVAPTLLALAGVAPAQDMPGRVLKEALDFEVPGPPVASYETGARAASSGAVDGRANAEIVDRLKSLGYIGDAPPAGSGTAPGMHSPQGERNLAGMQFEAGRYAEAAAAYERLLRSEPDDATLHTSLAGCLGALGRYDDAARHLDIAIKLEPLNAEAYHNRAVLYERQGKGEAALAQYRLAVKYKPDYEPSRQALLRLTGSAEVGGPRTEGEKQAAALAEQASLAARHGDYPTATRRLAEAEKLAPRYALVYQYQSNVAYLSGDLPAAIRALEKALTIEPGNALFETNLKRLREQQAKGTKK